MRCLVDCTSPQVAAASTRKTQRQLHKPQTQRELHAITAAQCVKTTDAGSLLHAPEKNRRSTRATNHSRDSRDFCTTNSDSKLTLCCCFSRWKDKMNKMSVPSHTQKTNSKHSIPSGLSESEPQCGTGKAMRTTKTLTCEHIEPCQFAPTTSIKSMQFGNVNADWIRIDMSCRNSVRISVSIVKAPHRCPRWFRHR